MELIVVVCDSLLAKRVREIDLLLVSILPAPFSKEKFMEVTQQKIVENVFSAEP